MNIDQLLFNAEEEVIRKEIANLVETKALKIWANRLNLQTHREVIARSTELREDIQNTNGEEKKEERNKGIKCRHCEIILKGKKEINDYAKHHHKTPEKSSEVRSPSPSSPGPSLYRYNAEDDVQSTINIPLQNDVSIQEIVNQAEQIFNKQQTAFKIQFSFGFILRHIETGEFR
uniref:Uncharacterized protein n=1 Tax=Magallana gigas TaxID=29159 RepID=A0A8W8MC46_MAGGI